MADYQPYTRTIPNPREPMRITRDFSNDDPYHRPQVRTVPHSRVIYGFFFLNLISCGSLEAVTTHWEIGMIYFFNTYDAIMNFWNLFE